MVRRTILIAEDDPGVRRLLEELLRLDGHAVVSVDSGESALVVASTQPFDLVVADYYMPGLTGIDLIRKLRELGIVVPSLILSSVVDDAQVLAKAFTAVEWLPTPFRIDSVRAAVERLLS